jgi:hypothetical protein
MYNGISVLIPADVGGRFKASKAHFIPHLPLKIRWIESEGAFDNNRKAKFYKLTPAGRKQLVEERSNWERLAGAINLVLKTA